MGECETPDLRRQKTDAGRAAPDSRRELEMGKIYGFSKRLKRIRDDFFSLPDKQQEAYKKGDRELFEQLTREFCEYSRRRIKRS